MQTAHLLGEVPGDRSQQLFLCRIGADVRELVEATVSSQCRCVQPLQVDSAHCCLPLRYAPLQVILIRICLKARPLEPDEKQQQQPQPMQWLGCFADD